MQTKTNPRRLAGELQLLRIRVATAESKLKVLREQAREARRRRKETKRLAQHARRQFKRGKANLAELKQAAARAEAKLLQAGGRALARKLAKSKPVVKTSFRASTKPKPVTRKPRPVLPGSTGAARKASAVKRSKAVSQRGARADALEPKPSTPQIPDTSTKTYEQSIPDQGQQEAEEQKV